VVKSVSSWLAISPADDRDAERAPQLGPFAEPDRERKGAQRSGERRHQDRTEA
jgi:hypothetical protein